MKIFISHSSKNKILGDLLVELLRNVGIQHSEIIFTSNTAYGIPVGQNIFHWLKSQITEKPFVIYLLSEEYYQSIACLNEMGAAWIIENKHAAIFCPNFNLSSKEFQSGSLDPREIGFYINDEERIHSLIQLLGDRFKIIENSLIITQSVRKFIKSIDSIGATNNNTMEVKTGVKETKVEDLDTSIVKSIQMTKSVSSKFQQTIKNSLFDKFSELILNNKLKDEELLLLYYVIDRSKFTLMSGWQEQNEIQNIKEWEEINEISALLSRNYSSTLNRFEIRGFIEVSDVTSYGNPKEYKIKDEIAEHLLDLDNNLLEVINNCLKRNFQEYKIENIENDDLPF
ncbi:toll/interleukin-1 receptor domain-containing protein [Sphingobacterium spiritivorum]|uniref:toll/interleukin-1 receptor domain-containing protein n=1 Tax=Sphingobacterium spiritivorum TaxID=258 RepID=UPI003DA5A39E